MVFTSVFNKQGLAWSFQNHKGMVRVSIRGAPPIVKKQEMEKWVAKILVITKANVKSFI